MNNLPNVPSGVTELIINWQQQALSNYRLSHDGEISAPMRRQHTALAIVYTSCAEELAVLYFDGEQDAVESDRPIPFYPENGG